jgi:hypothetical protein
MLAELSARFLILPPQEVDGAITDDLHQIVKMLGVDRAQLMRFVSGGEVVVNPSVADLPAEAGIDQASFRAPGTKANLTVPMRVAGRIEGALTFGCLRFTRSTKVVFREVRRRRTVDLQVRRDVSRPVRSHQPPEGSSIMNKSILRTLTAAAALTIACTGVFAQGTTQKLEKDSEKVWDATKADTKKAVDATGKAIDTTASDAAAGTRKAGDKIGEKIPGTTQNEAVKKAPAKP